ncbi:hypothetical protein [Azotobacter beijerinckii]|uniref:Uncharacterized protein n=1 Tax=Azotobacter beijerinckii TaxID=170623 RepID=A0A1I0Z3Q9_9GAMM|nr:hypothetical protein [Azotobacter beijerinckii]SFB19977.1 hypothetical protein SAMN04244571_01763 [Azotobacter beijerinckii]
MYDAINTLPSKEADRQRLARAFESHTRSGGAVTELTGYEQKPMPPRRSKIDPETVLKRRRSPQRELASFARKAMGSER